MASLLYMRLWRKTIETNYSSSPRQSIFLSPMFLFLLLTCTFWSLKSYCVYITRLLLQNSRTVSCQQNYKIKIVNAMVSWILFYVLSLISLFSMNIYVDYSWHSKCCLFISSRNQHYHWDEITSVTSLSPVVRIVWVYIVV